MSNIGDSMEKKGYVPLADDGRGAIGFKPSLKSPDKRLSHERWFYNKTFMNDGTRIAVMARTESELKDFLNKGFTPVSEEDSR
ncbi:MAG: hypothetical protein HY880_05665 [Deltaproteobacteria bacterium]|nr:hypothetical protein [Deltaproteobacteria bacterium]